MIPLIRSSVLLVFLGSGFLPGQEPASVDIGKLVENLASDSFQTREKATSDLWTAGEEALAALREASKSDDPEMSLRATELLGKIELRITPETSEEVLGLIRRYQEAPVNRKVNFLNELKRRKAYFQVLKLYSMEERADVRAGLASAIRGVAISGARESIAEGDVRNGGGAARNVRQRADRPDGAGMPLPQHGPARCGA